VVVVVCDVAGSAGATISGGVVVVSLTVLLKQPAKGSRLTHVAKRAVRKNVLFIRFILNSYLGRVVTEDFGQNRTPLRKGARIVPVETNPQVCRCRTSENYITVNGNIYGLTPNLSNHETHRASFSAMRLSGYFRLIIWKCVAPGLRFFSYIE
jgi:hypothetical protein